MMIKNIKHTSVYKSLKFKKGEFHAYLLYSTDKELNNNIALSFAKSLICENLNACEICNACKQFDSGSHPDVFIINQSSIKVDDANKIISKLNTKPISSDIKVFVVLNAENINEIAQNKLLKSLEEPNSQNIFIFTSVKTDKLLPTVMSRLKKLYIQKLSSEDKKLILKELNISNDNASTYINADYTLDEIINFETNNDYKETMQHIDFMFNNLKSSSDIPKVVHTLSSVNKDLFLPLLQSLFLDCLNDGKKFNKPLTMLINVFFSKKALMKCLPLIDEAYKKQMANVNFSYILDNLLFNILKEKFLCK